MLIWCLKQVKDFMIKFSISRSFLLEKELDMYIILIVSIPSGGCVDKVGNNRESQQGCKHDDYFLYYHIWTVIYFMNG